MKFKSFDVVETVLNEADSRFAPLFSPVKERVDILKQYCSAIDEIIEDNGGTEFECEVDEDDMTIRVEFVIEDIIVYNPKSDRFQQLAQRALSFTILPEHSEHIRIRFIFPSLWESA